MRRPPPRSTLFPYTTLFRSLQRFGLHGERQPPEPVERSLCRQGGRGAERPAAPLRAHGADAPRRRSEEHTSELQSHVNLVCRLLLEKKKKKQKETYTS